MVGAEAGPQVRRVRAVDADDYSAVTDRRGPVGCDRGAGVHVGGIHHVRGLSGTGLDDEVVAVAGQVLDRLGAEGDPALTRCTLPDDCDSHASPPRVLLRRRPEPPADKSADATGRG